jgi:hypothetical protein
LPEDNLEFPVDEFFSDESSGLYLRTCQVTLERGVYRQFFRYYPQVVHGIIDQGGHVVGGPDERAGGRAPKYGSDCYYAPSPGSGGLYDVSYLTPPFTPSNAKQWDIRF